MVSYTYEYPLKLCNQIVDIVSWKCWLQSTKLGHSFSFHKHQIEHSTDSKPNLQSEGSRKHAQNLQHTTSQLQTREKSKDNWLNFV